MNDLTTRTAEMLETVESLGHELRGVRLALLELAAQTRTAGVHQLHGIADDLQLLARKTANVEENIDDLLDGAK